jgi:hypothetical protein
MKEKRSKRERFFGIFPFLQKQQKQLSRCFLSEIWFYRVIFVNRKRNTLFITIIGFTAVAIILVIGTLWI